MTKQKQGIALPKRRGVTLIEIAIVLVIIGILLGGVLKGQELINNARVRATADQQNSLKVAWFSFLDRFGGMPGDYVFAGQYVRDAMNGDGDGIIQIEESPVVFQQLAAAGYIRCQQCAENDASAAGMPDTQNSLLNAYGGVMGIFHNGYMAAYKATPDAPTGFTYSENSKTGTAQQARLMIHTGPLIPSNIAAQVDLKVDDGVANEGEIVFNEWKGGTVKPTLACMSTARASQAAPTKLQPAAAGGQYFWRHASENPLANCGLSNNL